MPTPLDPLTLAPVTHSHTTTNTPNPATLALLQTYNPPYSRNRPCPQPVWDAVAATVRAALVPLAHLSTDSFQPHLSAMTKLAIWAHQNALPISVPSLLSDAVIDAYTRATYSGNSTARSQLRRIADANGIDRDGSGAELPKRSLNGPYTLEEINTFIAHASALTSAHRRVASLTVILLGAGCGVTRSGFRTTSVSSLHDHVVDGSSTLHVRNNERCIPVLDEFSDELRALAEISNVNPFDNVADKSRITTRVVSWMSNIRNAPAFSPDRLRAYFVCEHMRRGTSLMRLLEITGLQNTNALDGYLQFVQRSNLSCSAADPAAQLATPAADTGS